LSIRLSFTLHRCTRFRRVATGPVLLAFTAEAGHTHQVHAELGWSAGELLERILQDGRSWDSFVATLRDASTNAIVARGSREPAKP
jgi:hypothetical protein